MQELYQWWSWPISWNFQRLQLSSSSIHECRIICACLNLPGTLFSTCKALQSKGCLSLSLVCVCVYGREINALLKQWNHLYIDFHGAIYQKISHIRDQSLITIGWCGLQSDQHAWQLGGCWDQVSVACAPHYPLKLVTIVKQQLMTTCQTPSLQPSWKQSTHLWQEMPENFLLLGNMCRKLADSPVSMPGPCRDI